jgi:hypothetical protein
MPQFKKRDIEKEIKSNQKTNTGIWVQAGEIDHSDHDTKDWSDLQNDYVKMRNGHALISTTIDILKYPILMSEWRIEGKNKEVNHYIQFVFENLYKGFEYFKRHKLLALDFGLSMHEMVLEKGYSFGGKLQNRPIWFSPIQNETINQFIYDDTARFTGIEHERRVPETGSEFIPIDKKDLEWFSFNEEYNDIRGRSMLRPVRMFWEAQTKVLRARVQGIQRGAGIPAIATIGNPGSADTAKIQQMGRTIGQMNEGYISYDKEKMEVSLLEPKGQHDAMQMIEWLDRQIVFNTLSQFMVAGIGQNGSRAATGEHKTSYEMAASVILQALEDNFQALTNRIVQLSSYGNIPSSEYPEFHFNAITQTDLSKTAADLRNLIDSRLVTKQREDEKYIRELFSMPELKVTTEIVKPEDQKVSIFNKKLTKKERNVTNEMLEHEKNIFSLESAVEHYEDMESKISIKLDEKIHKYILDIEKQLSNDRKKDIHVRRSILETTIDELTSLYETGYNRGEVDIENELKKISTKLAVTKKDKITKRGMIEKLIIKMFFNIKTGIENKMETVSNEYIQKKGGLKDILIGFELGYKREKNNVKNIVEAGYVDGRGKTLETLSDNIDTFLYTAIMDKNTCKECAPLDGVAFTADEIRGEGLNFTHPINPNCLGQDSDRCQWVILKIKE